jgi:hypothetical protein
MDTSGNGPKGKKECPKCHYQDYPESFPVVTGRLRLEEGGDTFYLKKGENVLGRDATSGTADIKLSTDEYMSRRHAIIEALPLPGGDYEHRLKEAGSLNALLLNGKEVGRGETLALQPGDRLTLGRTTVTFERL